MDKIQEIATRIALRALAIQNEDCTIQDMICYESCQLTKAAISEFSIILSDSKEEQNKIVEEFTYHYFGD